MVIHKLHKIFVSAYNIGVQSFFFCLDSQCAYNIICFHTGFFQHRQIHGFQHVPEVGQLHLQLLRHFRAICLVFFIHIMTECLFLRIESTGDIIWIFRSNQFQDLISKPKKCTGMETVTGNKGIFY